MKVTSRLRRTVAFEVVVALSSVSRFKLKSMLLIIRLLVGVGLRLGVVFRVGLRLGGTVVRSSLLSIAVVGLFC